MREIFIAIAITFCMSVMTYVAAKRANEITTLNEAITTLERELAHNQRMLDDALRLLPALEHRTVKLQTEFSTREVIWLIADSLAEQGCEVHFH